MGQCVIRRLKDDGSPDRISFAAMDCPACTKEIKHAAPAIAERITYFTNLRKAVDDLVFFSFQISSV